MDKIYTQLEAMKKALEEKDGHTVLFSDKGPVGLPLVELIIEQMQAQAQEIKRLKEQVAKLSSLE